ncbi:hypothetical protein LINPERHAP1_LOCUS1813, partial [Linum perenne]
PSYDSLRHQISDSGPFDLLSLPLRKSSSPPTYSRRQSTSSNRGSLRENESKGRGLVSPTLLT